MMTAPAGIDDFFSGGGQGPRGPWTVCALPPRQCSTQLFWVGDACGQEDYFVRALPDEESGGGPGLAPRIDRARARLRAEAQRAQVAGNLGLGPVVRHSDPQGRAYSTDFVPGRMLTAAELRAPHQLALVADAMGRLGSASIDPRHSSGLAHPLRHVSVAMAGLGLTIGPCRTSGLLSLALSVEADLAALPRLPTTWVHTDLRPANLMRRGDGRLFIVDWRRLTLGCPMSALAYFAAMARIPPAELPALLETMGAFAPHFPRSLLHLRLETLLIDLNEVLVFGRSWAHDATSWPRALERLSQGLGHFPTYDVRQLRGDDIGDDIAAGGEAAGITALCF